MKKVYKLCRTLVQCLVISLIALAPLPAFADHSGDDKPHTSGGLRIGVVQGDQTLILVDEPALIKNAFDQGWQRARNEWNKHIVSLLNEMSDQSTIALASDLATVDEAELSMKKIDNGVSLKYVLPNNQLYLTLKTGWSFLDLTYVITFDLELVLAVQAPASGQRPHIADAALYLRRARIDGVGILSDLTKSVPEALLQNVQRYVEDSGSVLLPSLSEMSDQFLTAIFHQIPSDAVYIDVGVDSNDRAILLCFKADANDSCTFPMQ